MKYKLRMTPDQVIQNAVNAVKQLRSMGCQDIEFSPEDAGAPLLLCLPTGACRALLAVSVLGRLGRMGRFTGWLWVLLFSCRPPKRVANNARQPVACIPLSPSFSHRSPLQAFIFFSLPPVHPSPYPSSVHPTGRSDPAFLYEILGEVIKAGATTLNIPDTTGWTLPHEFQVGRSARRICDLFRLVLSFSHLCNVCVVARVVGRGCTDGLRPPRPP